LTLLHDGRKATHHHAAAEERPMNEDTFNVSIRKFLKMVGVSSQREIEHAVQHALAAGTIKGNETFPAKMTLEVAGLQLNVSFDGQIALE
jgi:hypothetical protein